MPPEAENVFLTVQQVREVDRRAVSELGIPSIVLMENAARNVSAAVMDLLSPCSAGGATVPQALILCGGGNNGGDGYAAARHLAIGGVAATIIAAKDPQELSGDAAINCSIAQRMGLPIRPASDTDLFSRTDVIVDALLGTGFQGQVRPPLDDLIRRCNQAAEAGTPVVSVDVPSGLDAQTGQPSDPTVRATLTVTFVAPKVGFQAPGARAYLGRVVVVDIGAPPWLVQRVVGATGTV